MKTKFLSSFTPSAMSQDVLEGIFVQRHKLADRLFKAIRDSVLKPSRKNLMLIGPRGIGKTHMVSLLYHRLRNSSNLKGYLLIAWLREEEWGITSLLDFVMRIFRALDDEYGGAALSEELKELYGQPIDEAKPKAVALLKRYVGEKKLLVIAENTETLLGELGHRGRNELRDFFDKNSYVTILGTNPRTFQSMSLQGASFHQFFTVRVLKELGYDDAVDMLTKIAERCDDHALAKYLQTPSGRARVRAMHHLAGGNPRVYILFSQFLTATALDELVEPFMRTLDALIPYYEGQIGQLSGQQKKIIDYLCDQKHAVSSVEIAEHGFLTKQTAGGQLKKLEDMGYVSATKVGRDQFFELAEPLMRLCLEMRRTRGKPARVFVMFLRLWFLKDELAKHVEAMTGSGSELDIEVVNSLKDSDLGDDTDDPRVESAVTDFTELVGDNDFRRALEVAEELVMIRGSAQDWARQGFCQAKLKDWNDAVESYRHALEASPNDAVLWSKKGAAQLILGQNEEARDSCEKAIELRPKVGALWNFRGMVFSKLEDWEEAVLSFRKSIDLTKDENATVTAWGNLSTALIVLGRHEEALECYEHCKDLDEPSPDVMFNRAEAMLSLGKWKDGILALDEALDNFGQDDPPRTGDTEALVKTIYEKSKPEQWAKRVKALVVVYEKHRALTALGQGLAWCIPSLDTSPKGQANCKKWYDTWVAEAENKEDFTVPLQLLKTAVEYKKSNEDKRILMELPAEARAISASLGIQMGNAKSDDTSAA